MNEYKRKQVKQHKCMVCSLEAKHTQSAFKDPEILHYSIIYISLLLDSYF